MDQLPSTSPSLSSNSPTPSDPPPSPIQPIPTQGNISVPQEPSNTLPIQERSIIKRIPIWLLIPIVYGVTSLVLQPLLVYFIDFNAKVSQKYIYNFIFTILRMIIYHSQIFGLMVVTLFIIDREIKKLNKLPGWLILSFIFWCICILIQIIFGSIIGFQHAPQVGYLLTNIKLLDSFVTTNIYLFGVTSIILFFTSKIIKTKSKLIDRIVVPFLILLTASPLLPIYASLDILHNPIAQKELYRGGGMIIGLMYLVTLPLALFSIVVLTLKLIVLLRRRKTKSAQQT